MRKRKFLSNTAAVAVLLTVSLIPALALVASAMAMNSKFVCARIHNKEFLSQPWRILRPQKRWRCSTLQRPTGGACFYPCAGKEEDPRVTALDAEELARENYAGRMQLGQ